MFNQLNNHRLIFECIGYSGYTTPPWLINVYIIVMMMIKYGYSVLFWQEALRIIPNYVIKSLKMLKWFFFLEINLPLLNWCFCPKSVLARKFRCNRSNFIDTFDTNHQERTKQQEVECFQPMNIDRRLSLAVAAAALFGSFLLKPRAALWRLN